ncbi:MAG: Unknown protein [uncultured Sulfurovum sp.]|uniref:Uncharacterized protein n=1 Tax=uncultured Sulfurovum sp. TaxID=269237 RepID=A0A6S6U6K4_9BACT|nr:MAG: Unknown protein [uncultured Sulfurovum sp.]
MRGLSISIMVFSSTTISSIAIMFAVLEQESNPALAGLCYFILKIIFTMLKGTALKGLIKRGQATLISLYPFFQLQPKPIIKNIPKYRIITNQNSPLTNGSRSN